MLLFDRSFASSVHVYSVFMVQFISLLCVPVYVQCI